MLRDVAHVYHSKEAKLTKQVPTGRCANFPSKLKFYPPKVFKNFTKLQTRGKNIQTWCASEWKLTYEI